MASLCAGTLQAQIVSGVDQSFNPNDVILAQGSGIYGYAIYKTIAQSDGKILIAGSFSGYNTVSGTASKNYLARLNADGTLDTTFKTTTGPSATVWAMVLQSDGKIIIGGDFTSYNGTNINRIARLNSDGSLDATFNVGTGATGGIRAIAIQSNGSIIIGGIKIFLFITTHPLDLLPA